MPISPPAFLIGLDLGQTTDPTAQVSLEREERHPLPPLYKCRHLKRWPLGVPYTDIVTNVLDFLKRPMVKGPPEPTLVVDQTGVGRAVVDMFRLAVTCRFCPVTITSGAQASRAPNGDYHVPKKDLVGALQILMGERRLQISGGLPDTKALIRELETFKIKVTTSGNEAFGAWREGEHDDLVLALGMAAWIGEHLAGPIPEPASEKSEMAKAPPGVFLE